MSEDIFAKHTHFVLMISRLESSKMLNIFPLEDMGGVGGAKDNVNANRSAVLQQLEGEVTTMAIHDKHSWILLRKVGQTRLNAALNVSQTKITRHTTLLVAPEARGHPHARISKIKATTLGYIGCPHILLMNDVLRKDEHRRRIQAIG
jgi:hypothetical protein